MTSYLAALAASCCLLLPALAQTQTPAIAHGAAEAAKPAVAPEAAHEKLSPSMRPLSPPVPSAPLHRAARTPNFDALNRSCGAERHPHDR